MKENNNVLEIKDLCVYAGQKELLHNLNLTIPAGEVHALFGPNGSGKTTLMMAIMGFSRYQVKSGQILLAGKDITELDITERARLGIGIAQQLPPVIPGVKLQQVLDYVTAGNHQQVANVGQLAKTADMEHFLNRDINGNLSGGEIRRAELLQLLAMQPMFSMMDEPDSGVDLEALKVVGELVNMLFSDDPVHPARRKAGLIITHSGNILNYVHVDKAHVMFERQIGCAGNPSIILDTISKYGYAECAQCLQEGV